jgi:GNAT superfamily N-acetyltransferase
MDIVRIDKDNIDEAINLLNLVFPKDIKRYNNPEIGLRCSLDPQEYKNYYDYFKLEKTTPYVLKDNGKIIGTTGLYHLKTDAPTDIWLGWFCIAPNYRGKGLGRKLLEWTMGRAREEGFEKLKLYTSDDPGLEVSQKLYEKLGFKKIGEEQGEGETLIYKEVKL